MAVASAALTHVFDQSCYAGGGVRTDESLLKMESDSAVLTLVGISFHHWGAKTEKSRDFAEWAFLTNQRNSVEIWNRTTVCR